MERLPYRATQAARVYQDVREMPVAVLLDNVRSLYNVGAFFRTADAAGLSRLRSEKAFDFSHILLTRLR